MMCKHTNSQAPGATERKVTDSDEVGASIIGGALMFLALYGLCHLLSGKPKPHGSPSRAELREEDILARLARENLL